MEETSIVSSALSNALTRIKIRHSNFTLSDQNSIRTGRGLRFRKGMYVNYSGIQKANLVESTYDTKLQLIHVVQ